MKKVFFLGPDGSYSHIIASKVFDKNDYEFIPKENFFDIVKETLSDNTSLGVLPIENSSTSNVHDNMDYLFKQDLVIVNEAYLQINLYLIGLKGAKLSDIQKVYSYPKALEQCAQYIRQSNFTVQESPSTAAARDLVLSSNDKTIAAIGSKELANNDNLQILDENIGDNKYNITRFVFVANQEAVVTFGKKNKASVMFTVPHKPGTLAKILAAFAAARMNLTKIESRPIPGTKWEYQFWVDIEEEENILSHFQLEKILEDNALTYKVIGLYPSGQIYES